MEQEIHQCHIQCKSSNLHSTNFLQVSFKMSSTQSDVEELSDTPMEVVCIEEHDESNTEEEKSNKKPEGPRTDLGKT